MNSRVCFAVNDRWDGRFVFYPFPFGNKDTCEIFMTPKLDFVRLSSISERVDQTVE